MKYMRTSILGGALCAMSLWAVGCGGGDTTDGAGCSSDDECRAGRMCIQGACMDPSSGNNSGNNTTGANNTTGTNNTTDPDMPPPVPDMTPDMPPPPPDMAPDMPPPPPDMDPPPVVGQQISVVPGEVNFGFGTTDGQLDVVVEVRNIGDAPLTLSFVGLDATPSSGFLVAPEVGEEAPEVIAPGASLDVTVSFRPSQGGQFENALVVESDDLDEDDRVIEVPLEGFGFDPRPGPCVISSPGELDFGLVPAMNMATRSITVLNCSTNENVTITELGFREDPVAPFSLSNPPSVPFALMPGESQRVDVQFAPTTDDEFENELRARTDAFPRNLDTGVFGLSGGCPEIELAATSELDYEGGDFVVARVGTDTVTLDASETRSPSGQVDFAWALTSAPPMSNVSLNANGADTIDFRPDVTGVYRVRLFASDPILMTQGCEARDIEIYVVDAPQMTVEIEWSNDNDVDLHVLRSGPMGMNFPMLGSMMNDLYYEAPLKGWGMNASSNGFHLGDDSDGEGPEGAILLQLEPGRVYRVVAQYTQRREFQRFRISGEVTVTNAATGTTSTETNDAVINPFPTPQNVELFEIDGTTGVITPL